MERIYELKNRRASLLDEAQEALDAHSMETYNAKMDEIRNLNTEISALEELNVEKGRFEDSNANMVTKAQVAQQQKEDQQVKNKLDKARSGNEYVNAFVNALRVGARVGRDRNGRTPRGCVD